MERRALLGNKISMPIVPSNARRSGSFRNANSFLTPEPQIPKLARRLTAR